MAEIAAHRFMVQATGVAGDKNIEKEEWAALAKADIQEFRLAVKGLPERGLLGAGGVSSSATAGGETVSGGGVTSAATSGSGDRENIQAKYEDLVKYTVKLEEDTLALQKEKETLEKAAKGSGQVYFTWWHLLLAMLIAVACSKMSSLGGM